MTTPPNEPTRPTRPGNLVAAGHRHGAAASAEARHAPCDRSTDPDQNNDQDTGGISVADTEQFKTRLLTRECSTCIFKPGNQMSLAPGRLRQLVAEARGDAGYIICHSTLPYAASPIPPAICRGFADRYSTWQLQVIQRLWGFIEVQPPDSPGLSDQAPTSQTAGGEPTPRDGD